MEPHDMMKVVLEVYMNETNSDITDETVSPWIGVVCMNFLSGGHRPG